MVAFLSGHLSILLEFFTVPIVVLVRSKVMDPAGILPVADFSKIIIALYV